MKRTLIVIAVALGACGDQPDLCADRPCLTSIDDLTDWAAVSIPHEPDARCDFVEETKFIAPATGDAALRDVVFQDVGEHRLHLDFMTQVLPEYFGGLSLAQYQAIIQRRATRQYWAGSLYRLTDIAGVTIGYGFDVVVDAAFEEQLTEDETAAIAALLGRRFHLPLVYAPVGSDAIYLAGEFQTLVAHFPRNCSFTTCPTPGTDCVVVPEALSLCGHFWEGRDLETELANKARVAVAAKTVELPRGLGTFTVPAVFDGGEHGAARTPLVPAGATASYTARTLPGGYVERVITQAVTIGGAPYEVRLTISVPDDGGGFLFTEPSVNVGSGSAYLAPPDTMTNDQIARLSSCTASTLEHWQARGVMAGGDGFTIDYRYQPPGGGSGPLFVTGASVTLGGATATVDDYFRLVYAGEHHNWNNQYWILFDAPITYAGHPVHGLWIDELDFRVRLESAHTLDDQRQPLDVLDVTGYTVGRAP